MTTKSYAILCAIFIVIGNCDSKTYRIQTECNSIVIHDYETGSKIGPPVKTEQSQQNSTVPVILVVNKTEQSQQNSTVPVILVVNKTEQSQQLSAAPSKPVVVSKRMPCTCTAGKECTCCAPISLRQQNFNQQGCLKFTYNSTTNALSLQVLTNNKRIFETQLTRLDAPPLCIPIPPLPTVAICIALTNIQVEDFFSIVVCIRLEVQILQTPFISVTFDCIRFGPNGISIANSKRQSIATRPASIFSLKTSTSGATDLEVHSLNVTLPSSAKNSTTTQKPPLTLKIFTTEAPLPEIHTLSLPLSLQSSTTQKRTVALDGFVTKIRMSTGNSTIYTDTSSNSTTDLNQTDVYNKTLATEWIAQDSSGEVHPITAE